MAFGTGAGIDLVAVSRFSGMRDADPFIEKTFTREERAHAFSNADPAPHLAGIFAAKEAVWKALTDQSFPFYEIEIRRGASGKPEAWHADARLSMHVSITHTDALAAAVAIAYA